MILSLPKPALLVTAICLSWVHSYAESGSWKKVKTEDGVTVYEKKVSGKLACRGVGQG